MVLFSLILNRKKIPFYNFSLLLKILSHVAEAHLGFMYFYAFSSSFFVIMFCSLFRPLSVYGVFIIIVLFCSFLGDRLSLSFVCHH